MTNGKRSHKLGIISLILSCGSWIGFLLILGLTILLSPAENDKSGWFIVGALFLILFSILLASFVIAVIALLKPNCSKTMPVISLFISALPIVVLIGALLRTILSPSSFH